jgi:hypothetical protein
MTAPRGAAAMPAAAERAPAGGRNPVVTGAQKVVAGAQWSGQDLVGGTVAGGPAAPHAVAHPRRRPISSPSRLTGENKASQATEAR